MSVVSVSRRGSKSHNMSSGADAYYTPFPIAARLIKFATRAAPARILDPACGDGSLLDAAHQKWPQAFLLANDQSKPALKIVRGRLTVRSHSSKDFLRVVRSPHLLASCRAFWHPDLILLNPPFEARSTHRFEVSVGVELTARVSRAAAFLIGSAQLLAPGGQLLAVLPASFATSQRDQVARELLIRLGRIELIEQLPRDAFPDCHAATLILRFSRRSAPQSWLQPTIQRGNSPNVLALFTVVRGNTPVHSLTGVESGSLGLFVHTTDIRDGLAIPRRVRLPVGARRVRGACVLVPRVGRPSHEKVVASHFVNSVALSDCVFAITTRNLSAARILRNQLLDRWTRLQQCYSGTGAPHITATVLQQLLAEGVSANRTSGQR